MRKITSAAVLFAIVASPLFAGNRSDAGFVGRPQDPNQGGGSCATPVDVASLPFSDAGTTCGATNTITNYGGPCGVDLPFPYGGEDEVYRIVLGAGNNVAFSADLTGSTGDLALFLITTCGSGPSCVANSQDAIGPGTGPEDIAAAAYPVGTYFLYVDSYYDAGSAGSCGTYTLNVTGTFPSSSWSSPPIDG